MAKYMAKYKGNPILGGLAGERGRGRTPGGKQQEFRVGASCLLMFMGPRGALLDGWAGLAAAN